MHSTSLFLLLIAAAAVAIVHSILPDHWVPLAVIARTQRWSIMHVVRVTLLASLGHVVTSFLLGGVIALIGLQFQKEIDIQQGHIVGGVLVLTGLIFLLWGLLGHGSHTHGHDHMHNHGEEHNYNQGHDRDHTYDHEQSPIKERSLVGRLTAIAVPFGVAASPDLTILPVALAASALGGVAIAGVLGLFALVTIVTFIGLTVVATLLGYQIKGDWLEKNANSITSFVLIAVGVVAYVGF